jgi:ABC-type Fe3+/spermidine/putrescine transport system ATPase subunit
MIRVQGLQVKAGDFKLRDISLTIEDSRYGVILGPSGAGKSLLLEAIVGLRRPERGRIHIGKNDVTGISPESRNLAYVPQAMTLFPHLSVRENLCFGANARHIPSDEINQGLSQLARLLDIEHLLSRRNPLTLSHGEQQRVTIARALMIKPRAILLDEPFSALDEQMRRQLQLQLKMINRELKMTVLHVTHDREEAFMLGDTIGIIIDGSLMQVGDRDDIYYRPVSVEVAKFLINQNIFSGQVAHRDDRNKTLHLRGAGLNIQAVAYNGLKPGDPVHFGIRPEEIMVIRPGKKLHDPVQANILEGHIETILKKGGSHIILIKVPEIYQLLEIDMPNCAFRELDLTEGKQIQVSLKRKSIWTIPGKHTTGVQEFMT